MRRLDIHYSLFAYSSCLVGLQGTQDFLFHNRILRISFSVHPFLVIHSLFGIRKVNPQKCMHKYCVLIRNIRRKTSCRDAFKTEGRRILEVKYGDVVLTKTIPFAK